MSETGTTALTVEIVTGYLKKNAVAVADLPNLIATVRTTLDGLGKTPEPVRRELAPAVPIRRSVTPEYIVCLEDGKKLKMLKRHLKTVYDMTPDQYRARWGLPPEYPMVAPNYAKARSEMAKSLGLGRMRGSRNAAPETAPEPEATARGRRKRAAA